MPDTDQATRYREIRRLGAGGMATVTLADDTVLGRPVALKRVYGVGDHRNVLRLKREALVGASLNHPNLVFVYDAQLQDDGDVVIVMEYVEGENLADLIHARGAMPAAEAMPVLRGVATALDAIHEQGIVHRDVKPANVLLGTDGAVKLADLGVAYVADRTNTTTTGAVVGSFSYMAAEQLDGAPPSPAMDVYALGAVAYEMLAGEKARPESNPLALAHAISTQPPPDLRRLRPEVPHAAAAVLQRAMSADPAQRPASAGELVRRLDSAFAPEQRTEAVPGPAAKPPVRSAPVSSRPVSSRPVSSRSRRASMLVPGLLALAALAIAAVLVAVLGSGGGPSKQASKPTTTTARRTSHHPAATTTSSSRSTTTSASTPSASGSGSTASASGSTASASGSTPSASGSTPSATGAAPAAAVEQFYTAAAQHDYAAAWALADPNLRNQLHGYAAFQNLMSPVRSITFHSAQTLAGAGSGTATVEVQTTSVQTNQTQQCSGSARTVRSSGGNWLVDGVSITCT